MSDINMNKLYALQVVTDINYLQKMLAASNCITKLQSISTCREWNIVNDPNDKSLKRRSKEGEFPYFTIREIPYVC